MLTAKPSLFIIVDGENIKNDDWSAVAKYKLFLCEIVTMFNAMAHLFHQVAPCKLVILTRYIRVNCSD